MAMRSCRSCLGFVPDDAKRCPNCETTASPAAAVAWWATRGAMAGTAAFTLMACYGLPPSWALSEEEGGPSSLLDAESPQLDLAVELGVTRQALGDIYDEPEVDVHVLLTPLTERTEVRVTTSVDGGEPQVEMHRFRTAEAHSFGISAGGYESDPSSELEYLSCEEDRCTHQVSISVVVLEGEALMESTARISVYGSSEDRPKGAEVWAQWQ